MHFKFIGENGSCGFLNGEVYDVELYQGHTMKSYKPTVVAVTRYKEVPYESMEHFNKNWERIG